MMEALPPAGDALATRADLAELRQELATLGTGLRQEIGPLEVRSDLRMEALEHRLVAVFRGELIAAITAQTRSMVFAMAGRTVTVSGIAFAATRLTG